MQAQHHIERRLVKENRETDFLGGSTQADYDDE